MHIAPHGVDIKWIPQGSILHLRLDYLRGNPHVSRHLIMITWFVNAEIHVWVNRFGTPNTNAAILTF